MTGIAWRDAAARAAFFGAGLTTLEEFAACRAGTLVTSARTRWLRRMELGGQAWFVKVQDCRGRVLPLRRWPSAIARGAPVAREAAALDALAGHGFRCPDVVAHGASRGLLFPRVALLVTRAVPGHVDLATWLLRRPDAAAARRAMDAAEELLRRAHERGLVLLGAKYRNILVPENGPAGADDLVLIDQPDMCCRGSARLRAKDWRLLRRDRERFGGGA